MLPNDAPKPDTPADRLARAARASWLAPAIVVSLNCFSNSATQRVPSLGLAVAVLQFVLLVGGLAMGLFVLSRARKVADGSRVVAPALIGTALCAGILVLNVLFLTGRIKPPTPPATAPTTAPTSAPASAPATAPA